MTIYAKIYFIDSTAAEDFLVDYPSAERHSDTIVMMRLLDGMSLKTLNRHYDIADYETFNVIEEGHRDED